MQPSLIRSTPPSCPADFNLVRFVLAGSGAEPGSTALEVVSANDTHRWSRADFARAVLGMAGALTALDLPEGARVILRLGDEIGFPFAFFGCIAAGLIPVPVSAMLTGRELGPMIESVSPSLILANAELDIPATDVPVLRDDLVTLALRTPPLAQPKPSSANDPAYILFTSGSGGRAKPVLHAHRAAWARRMMWAGWYGLQEGDRMLHAGAFNWSYTLGTGLTDPLASGATALLIEGDRGAPRLAAIASEHEATILAAVPGVWRKLTTLPDLPRFQALRHGLSAGEALPTGIRAAWTARTGTDIHEALGMTEISTFLSSSPARPAPPGALGYAQPGRTLALLDETGAPVPRGMAGTLAVAANDPGLMLGYGAASPPDCPWFVTSDLMQMAEDGALTYLGRIDDVLTAQGYRVSPLEVEAVLEAHPSIDEAALTQVEVRPGLTLLAVFIRGNVTAAELTTHCEANLARYKWPRHAQKLDDLPRGPTGKLLRRALPALYDPDGSLP